MVCGAEANSWWRLIPASNIGLCASKRSGVRSIMVSLRNTCHSGRLGSFVALDDDQVHRSPLSSQNRNATGGAICWRQSTPRQFTGGTPGTAERYRQYNPTAPLTQRRYACQFEPRGHRQHCRELPHALFLLAFHKGSFRRSGRSRGPSLARTHIGRGCPRHWSKRMRQA